MEKNRLSIIVPCFNEEQALPIFYSTIIEIARELEKKDVLIELIFVDDGSKDRTLSLLRELHQQDARVRYLSLSRNFGKESAMFAGLQASKGDYVAVMDVDLQDPPSLLPEMYAFLQENLIFDCVATRRISRKGEPPIRSFFARLFYRLINRISKTEVVDGARDFRLMTRTMVDALLSVQEYNRFSKGIFGWVGFQTKWIEYENCERVAGESKWSFWKLLLYSLDGIVAFSSFPLAISSFLGFIFCLTSFIWIAILVVKTLIWGDPVSGYPSLACLVLFIGGIQLFNMGILGQYLSKTYLEVKQRPIYILKESEMTAPRIPEALR